MQRTTITLTIILVAAGSACGGDQSGDAAPADSSTPFDPDMMYPGEGDACRFTVTCEPLQVCVDGACARHERLSVEDVRLGELRVLRGDEAAATPLGDPPIPWADVVATTGETYTLRGWTSAVERGPALAALIPDETFCQVVVADAGFRVVALEDFPCGIAAVGPGGDVIVAPDIIQTADGPSDWAAAALIGADGAERWQVEVPDVIADEVSRDTGGMRTVGAFTSFLFDGDRILGSLALPRHTFGGAPPHDGVAFVEIDATSGEMALLEIAGESVQSDGRGWLLRDEAGVHAVMATYTDTGDRDGIDPTDFSVYLLSFDTGLHHELFRSFGFASGLFQLGPTEWVLEAYRLRTCDYVFQTETGSMPVPWHRLIGECPSLEGPANTCTQGESFGDPPDCLPSYAGHPEAFAVLMAPPFGDEVLIAVADEAGGWTEHSYAASPGTNAWGYGHAFVSRWNLTVEGLAYSREGLMEWVELALERR